MTINGPAPSILAMFMNAAIDQNLDKFNQGIVQGEPTLEPRTVATPIRIPLPMAPTTGSIRAMPGWRPRPRSRWSMWTTFWVE